MCDYMYYEHRQRGKIKNSIPAEEEPELEKITTATEEEQQPMTVRA
ncbi:MAG TPA: hypothetical protein VF172_09880 [Nitrososphaera sp.]|jgi:hypothetical protein